MNEKNKKLTNAELLVMTIIWDNKGDLMVLSEVLAAVNDRFAKTWKPQTVSTYLHNLVQKRFLKIHRNGKVYTYEPLKEKDATVAEIVMELFANCYPGMEPMSVLDQLLQVKKGE